MNKKTTALFSAFLMLLSAQKVVSADVQISGKITDIKTGQPIPDANIIISGTDRGTVSGDGGFYFLSGLAHGTYSITVRVIGYAESEKQISVPGENQYDFALEPRAIEFDPVIVSATLTDHRQSTVTVASEVLTVQRMDELNGNTAGEIVESVGGLYTKSYDSIAGLNTPSMRGTGADHVLVMLNGVRLNTAQGGGVDLNTIPLDAVQRIEIVKGGHSALVGADAVGGIINLISKDVIGSRGFKYGVHTTIGTFGTKMYTVSGAHKAGPVSLFASYTNIQSNGDFEYDDPVSNQTEKRINNDSKINSVFLKGDVAVNSRNDFEVVYTNAHTEKGAAGSVAPDPWTRASQTTPHARSDIKRSLLSIHGKNRLTDRLLIKEQAGFHTYSYNYVNPDGWAPVDDLHENRSITASAQAQYTLSANVSVLAGGAFQKDDLTSTTFTDVDSRVMASVFGQAELNHTLGMTRWTWIPAVRYDDYNDVGSQASPKLGFLAETGRTYVFAVKGNAGKSYRVPSLNDLYWPADAYTAGNPDLVPESGTNVDAGVVLSKKASGLLQIEATYFSNYITDLIAWQPGDDFIWRPANIGKAVVNGVETGVRFRSPGNKFHVSVFYTKMKATDQTEDAVNEGKRLIYRPDDKMDIVAGLNMGRVSVNVNYRIVGKTYTTADNAASLDAYQLLNANIRGSLNVAGFDLFVRVQGLNLLDNRIFLYDGYPMPGREVRVTVGAEY